MPKFCHNLTAIWGGIREKYMSARLLKAMTLPFTSVGFCLFETIVQKRLRRLSIQKVFASHPMPAFRATSARPNHYSKHAVYRVFFA